MFGLIDIHSEIFYPVIILQDLMKEEYVLDCIWLLRVETLL